MLAVAAIAGIGIVGFFLLLDWMAEIREMEPARARKAVASALLWCACTVALPIVALGTYLWSVGARVRREERFPLPRARLVRDTPILTGRAARTRGVALQVLGVFLLLVVSGMLIAMYRLSTLLV